LGSAVLAALLFHLVESERLRLPRHRLSGYLLLAGVMIVAYLSATGERVSFLYQVF
jgi:hypothetical protein